MHKFVAMHDAEHPHRISAASARAHATGAKCAGEGARAALAREKMQVNLAPTIVAIAKSA